MLVELNPSQFQITRSLFQDFTFSLSIEAAILGNNPGRIFVDNVRSPNTGFALTVEGYLLAGDSDNPATNAGLHKLLRDRIFTGEIFINGNASMSLAVYPERWVAKLPEIIPTHQAEYLDRYHYICNDLKFDWRNQTPHGYSVRRVDRSLLNTTDISFTDEIREWMDIEQVWWTERNFLEKGTSYAIIFNHEVVAWCTPDCVAGNKIDLGVYTLPSQRRKGLASIVVAATIEDCFAQGFKTIGWHCNAENVGSWKTAEKLGFKRNCDYTYYYFMYDPVDHLAELGWYNYRNGNYSECVRYYNEVFTQRHENPDYYYHLAASAHALLGNVVEALKCLEHAAKCGWANVEFTHDQEEFSILHGMPKWREILVQMKANGAP